MAKNLLFRWGVYISLEIQGEPSTNYTAQGFHNEASMGRHKIFTM